MDEAWRVDQRRCVWYEGAMAPLSPKVLAVLRPLVAQAGQLVTKEALLEAGSSVGKRAIRPATSEREEVWLVHRGF